MRKYANFQIDELEKIFASEKENTTELNELLEELKLRKQKKRITDLKANVEMVIFSSSGLNSVSKKSSGRTSNSKSVNSNKKSTNFKATGEQLKCVEAFSTGENLKINAYAGSGKTSTLKLIADSTERKGIYLAFNRKIVIDARQKFGKNVSCYTTHSLAIKELRKKYDIKKLVEPLNPNFLAEQLNLRDIRCDGSNVLKARTHATLVMQAIREFCHSSKANPLDTPVPRIGATVKMRHDVWEIIEKHTRAIVKDAWEKMCDPSNPIPLGHDGYFKLWALSKPKILGDFILVDEAQDLNPVLLSVLKQQSAQLVYVGDPFQQIYDWRGAVNAMQEVETPKSEELTMSFRFGQTIASLASILLKYLGAESQIKGDTTKTSYIGPVEPDVVLTRTNASAFSYLVEAIDRGDKPFLLGDKKELFRLLNAVVDLKNGKTTDVPEFFGFNNWEEVLDFVNSGEGEYLATFVNLVQAQGEKKLKWALTQTVDEENATITISTAHKAKGIEWDRVRIAGDFFGSILTSAKKVAKIDPSEVRLFYVAITRAKVGLEVDTELFKLFADSKSDPIKIGTEQYRFPGFG